MNHILTSTRIVEIDVGIIAASMSAMPIFFSKSKIFKTATYSSLRAKLAAARHPRRTSRSIKWPQRSEHTSPVGPDRRALHSDAYLELQEI